MNNDSNDMFGNDNVTQQANNKIGVNPVQDVNTSVNNTNPTSVTNSINVQPNMHPNQNINNNIPLQQNFATVNQVNDDELLKAFIGNNYEKITTRPFNFAGFFFTSFYMFYRKMFGYALLVFLLNLVVLNIINNFIITIGFCVVIGLFVNKIYLSYAKKKIAIIKVSNPQKSTEELKTICATKGGTSVGKIFLGFLTELVITFAVLFVMMLIGIGGAIGEFFNIDNWNIAVNNGSGINDDSSSSSKSGTLVEDVIVNGYSCFNSQCNIYIQDSNGITEYVFNDNNIELIKILGYYSDYIKVNIYYNKKGEEKSIVDYEVFLKSNNENISNVKTENELRDKIGLYLIGTHTDTFTLTEIGSTGFVFQGDSSYTYTSYTFVDSKNIEYEMKYINDNGTLNLVEGNKYTVTFEVAKDILSYEFTIKSIK